MKWSICNEILKGKNFDTQCRTVKEYGFDGLEIAPFTLKDGYSDFSSSFAKEISKTLERNDLEYVGMHWLISKPKSMTLVSFDSQRRNKSIDALKALIDFSSYLGGGALTLGCPNSRNEEEIKLQDRRKNFLESLYKIGEYAKDSGTKILIEPLSPDQTDLLNTLSEVREVINELNSSGLASMFDYHNTYSEKEDWVTLIRNNKDLIKHVHVNKMNGLSPNNLDTDEYLSSIIELSKLPIVFSLESFGEDEDISLKHFKSFRDSIESSFLTI